MPIGRRLLTQIGIAVAILVLTFGAPASAWASQPARYEPPVTATTTPAPESTPALAMAPAEDAGLTAEDPAESTAAISAPSVQDEPAPQDNVRPRPDSRPIELSTPPPTPSPTPQTPTPEAPPVNPRLDEPVLRWLPEILAASAASGTPPDVIAGVMRLESDGDPRIISPVGARGQMQIMPDNLIAMGVPEELWHDPATNTLAGATYLAAQAAAYGDWQGAVGAYFGFGCDVFGTCTQTYIAVAFSWAAYYAPAIADPLHSGFGLLPADWSYGEIVPFVEAGPPPVETPPASLPTPSATPPATATATSVDDSGQSTPVPTAASGDNPTPIPTDVVPTEAPTAPPVEERTEPPAAPTEVPVEEPTQVPVEAPTEPPADAQGAETTPSS